MFSQALQIVSEERQFVETSLSMIGMELHIVNGRHPVVEKMMNQARLCAK